MEISMTNQNIFVYSKVISANIMSILNSTLNDTAYSLSLRIKTNGSIELAIIGYVFYYKVDNHKLLSILKEVSKLGKIEVKDGYYYLT